MQRQEPYEYPRQYKPGGAWPSSAWFESTEYHLHIEQAVYWHAVIVLLQVRMPIALGCSHSTLADEPVGLRSLELVDRNINGRCSACMPPVG